MRIFVSSSFQDLREHRNAAIRVLRQMGHEVLAMEDMVAGSATPLTKVLEMVDRSEAYLGLFAWRYGHVPKGPKPAEVPDVDKAIYGTTSITHFAWFTTPSDLEARVAAAVTMAGLTRQLNLQPTTALGPGAGSGAVTDSSAAAGIAQLAKVLALAS